MLMLIFERNHRKLLIKVFTQSSKQDHQDLYFRANLADVVDGVRLFLQCPQLWRSGTACKGQKLNKQTDGANGGSVFQRQSNRIHQRIRGRVLANIMNVVVFSSVLRTDHTSKNP